LKKYPHSFPFGFGVFWGPPFVSPRLYICEYKYLKFLAYALTPQLSQINSNFIALIKLRAKWPVILSFGGNYKISHLTGELNQKIYISLFINVNREKGRLWFIFPALEIISQHGFHHGLEKNY
jgi:hypothetical protein